MAVNELVLPSVQLTWAIKRICLNRIFLEKRSKITTLNPETVHKKCNITEMGLKGLILLDVQDEVDKLK